MKIRSLLILAIAVLWPLAATAQITFPIGVWSGWVDSDKAEAVYRGADTCGINIINLCAAPEELQSRLSLLKSIGQKAMITAAWASSGDSWHNLMRLSGGVYRRQEPNNTYYGRANRSGYYKRPWLGDSLLLTRVGHYDDNAWACTTAVAGYALFWDPELSQWNEYSSDYVKYRNHNCREPWQNMEWYYESERSYTVRFGLKYVGTNDGQPVCRIGVVPITEGYTYRRSDSVMVTLTTDSFPGSNVYKAFNVKFTRSRTDSTQWRDFVVYTYGNKDLYVDYVQVQDAVYDSLSQGIFNQNIEDIASFYSGPTASNKEAVFRYYLSDEPYRSQFESTKLMFQQLNILAQQNGTATGMVQIAPCEPGSYGEDTAIYYDYINATSPTELSINLLPVFGNGVSLPQTRTPVDSGFGLQKQFDTMAVALSAAKHAAAGANIPLWVQVQTFGDYKINPDSSLDTALQGEGVWRMPTPRELSCLVNLSLCYGATGIFYYVYVDGQVEYTAGGQQWYQMGLADHTGAHREPQWSAVKNLNAQIKTLAPGLLNLAWVNAFRSVVPAGSYITAVSDSFIQVGLFHGKDNENDKYFMLVNRHCLPSDTLTVTVNINNAEPFFITDMLTGAPASGQLPAGANVPFSYKLQPGEGRLFRLVPFTAQIKINQNAAFTNFRFVQVDDPASSSLHSVDSVQITQKYWVTASQQDSLAYAPSVQSYWGTSITGWLPYSSEAIHYLQASTQDSANKFDIQYKIGGGKTLTPKYAAQIYFNDAPPSTGSIAVNSGAVFTNSQTVNVKLAGTDVFPGLSQMRFAEAPFGNDSGYANLVKNGTFEDTTNWVLANAEFYDGFLHLKGVNTGPGPAQIGSSAKQIIPGSEINPHRNKLFRLTDDIYSHDVISSYKYVDVFYADSLFPNGVRLLDKPIASTPEVVWKSSSDTFTLKVDTARPLDRIEISYNIFGIELPPPPPDPGTLFNTITVDNIRLEPVELKTGVLPDNVPENSYVFDGWDYADTNYPLYYKLSPDDGTKRVYMQLRDLPGNISTEPGWYDDITLDMTKPVVSLDIPLDLSYVNGTVPVCGWSADQNFKDWTLDCQPYASDNWQALSNNTTHVNVNGPYYSMLLYPWNTDMLSDDIYMLRFTANDLAGNARADTHYVQVLTGPDLPAQAITSEFATFNSLPVDATCDNFGNIFVTDTQADKIWKFSPEGDSLLCFGYKYTCQDTLGLNHPKGIAVDDSDNIWITDCYQSKVKKYDSAGNFLSTIGKYGNQQGEFNQPTGIAISGNEIYVVDHLNGRVQVFNKTGAFIRQFGNNCLNQPSGIAIRNNEAEKLVYVCDSQNDRIAIFDTSGNLVNSLDSLGLDKPWDICFDNNNNLYIADVYNNRVIELDPWHNKLLTFGIQGQEAGQFKLPQGLAVSPDGKYLYVADTHNDRLQRFKMFFDMGALGGAQFAGKRQITNSAPTVFGLSQCYPNPCKQATNIEYQIAKPGAVNLKVYNTLGQAVKTLVNENQQPGYYSINWDGKDESTRQVAAGIYFYRLQAGSFSSTKKAVVLR